MRFAGIDIGAERHVVAVVDEAGGELVKATSFGEEATGYRKLLELLGPPEQTLIAMEATGHYWQNLFAVLAAQGYSIALLNPLRTHRFAGEDLQRAKTDAIDALSIARFAQQKRPVATPLPDPVARELRELVRFRDRLVQDHGDRLRQLHRLVDLVFPELTRHVDLASERATAVLHAYPTAAALRAAKVGKLAQIVTDGRHRVGKEVAQELVAAATTSVGQHQGHAYELQVRCLCEDLDVLRRRIRALDDEIGNLLDKHEVGKLLTTIDGIGPNTAARLIAELDDPARFKSSAALAAYVGVVPATSQSGKRERRHAPLAPTGNGRLRMALWMPTLSAVKHNPWLRQHYQRLVAAGKLRKVALVASMRKLLIAVYTVAKHRKPFVPILTEAAA